jgi:ABC-type phosphate transport system substrate-binding protein
MRKLLYCFHIVLLAAPLAFADDLVVIVNKSNPVASLTKVQLRKLLLGEQNSWSGGKPVSLILRAPGQPEREGVLRSVCGMSEDDFTQHQMHANFGGTTAAPPKALGSAAAVRQLVMTVPGAIGFVRAADVTDSVKAVPVDGLNAGQPGYKIRVGD